MEKRIAYSEIFGSIQGEGEWTGNLMIWVRFFGCNLKCQGFGQKDPTNPTEFPYETVDFKKYNRLEDLPVFPVGCDSYYSWNPKFKHLAKKATVKEICDKIVECGVNTFGLDKNRIQGDIVGEAPFHWHPRTGNNVILGFTGGEPLLYQNEMLAIHKELKDRGIRFDYITVETNGTKPLLYEFPEEFYFSVSPKLRSVSGEIDAVKPNVINMLLGNANTPNAGWLKFVVTSNPRCWEEIDECLDKINFRGDIWVMPMGATAEQQLGDEITKIAEEAMKRGFHIAARTQNYLFKNAIGK